MTMQVTVLLLQKMQQQIDLSAYIKNIKSVNVNGKDYAASGKKSVTIINKDGSLNESATPFKDAKPGD